MALPTIWFGVWKVGTLDYDSSHDISSPRDFTRGGATSNRFLLVHASRRDDTASLGSSRIMARETEYPISSARGAADKDSSCSLKLLSPALGGRQACPCVC